MATSKVENSALVSSCKLKFVQGSLQFAAYLMILITRTLQGQGYAARGTIYDGNTLIAHATHDGLSTTVIYDSNMFIVHANEALHGTLDIMDIGPTSLYTNTLNSFTHPLRAIN
jgi:hypothetical protein